MHSPSPLLAVTRLGFKYFPSYTAVHSHPPYSSVVLKYLQANLLRTAERQAGGYKAATQRVGQSVALESVCVMAVQCGELGRPVSVFSASHVDCWTVV